MKLSLLLQFIALFGVSSDIATVTSALQCYECSYNVAITDPKSLCMEVRTPKTLVNCSSGNACYRKTFIKEVKLPSGSRKNLTMATWGCFSGNVNSCTSVMNAAGSCPGYGCKSLCWQPSANVTVPTPTTEPTTKPTTMAPTSGSGIHHLTTTLFLLVFFLIKEMVVY